MRADATVVAERGQHHRTRCTTLRSSPPLSLRPTPDGLHLLGSAAGPIGGDDVHLALTLTDGAALTVRTVAAQVALPGPRAGPSSAEVRATVGDGATLRWLPQPLVLAERSDHRVTAVLALAATASVVWREEVVLGRHGEGGGSLLQRLRVDRGGRPLLRSDLALGPVWPGADGPAGIGTARVVGTALVVGAPAAAAEPRLTSGVRSARCRLDADAVLVTALGESYEAVHEVLASLG